MENQDNFGAPLPHEEDIEAATPTGTGRLFCEYPHKDSSGKRISCPNHVSHIVFGVNHSDPENPEISDEGFGFVCEHHGHEAIDTAGKALRSGRLEHPLAKRLVQTVMHLAPMPQNMKSVNSVLNSAGIRRGSDEQYIAQDKFGRKLASFLTSFKDKPIPPGRMKIDGSSSQAALPSAPKTPSPVALTPHAEFLLHERAGKNYAKQIASHGNHTLDDFDNTLTNYSEGNLEKVCPACLMKSNPMAAEDMLTKHQLTLGPMGIYTPHPADTPKEAAEKVAELDKRDALRKSYGLEPLKRDTVGDVGRRGLLRSGDTGHFTVRVRTRDVERALPSGITPEQNDIARAPVPYATLSSFYGATGEQSGLVPFAANLDEKDEKGSLPTDESGNVLTDDRVKPVARKSPFPSESIAPRGTNDLKIRRNFNPEFTPASLFQGTKEYNLHVKQHPFAPAGTPIAWHEGRAVHVLRETRESGGTVWLPSDVPAMKHQKGCPNSQPGPHRSACLGGCRNLTSDEVLGSRTLGDYSHRQEFQSRRPNENENNKLVVRAIHNLPGVTARRRLAEELEVGRQDG